MSRLTLLAAGLLLLGCAARTPAPPVVAQAAPRRDGPADQASGPEPVPLVPPAEAHARGWMPLSQTGVPEFLARHPTYDGRGVLIAILDSGIDAGIPGLGTTTTGDTKLLDLRDFSGEGSVALSPVTPVGDQVTVAGRVLSGVSRLRAVMVGTRLWAGSIAEIPLGEMPAADLNGDRDDADTLAVVVARASDGWVLYADTDGDGSLANERPVHDYLHARETFSWRSGSRPATISIAANFREQLGAPRLDLYFDTSAHGSHVAGIAAGHAMYGVEDFNGVAPGAYLLGLKIANNAHGGISTTGSMLAGIAYAIRFARDRRLPLVLNMSFGVGNEAEGRARIDGIIDSILARHPDVVFTISAGNDGPGLSTMGFPGSAGRAITVGATFPAVFLGASGAGLDPVAYFSSRGGELAKPEIVAPGMAYSTVPRWDTGDERKGGTSMASPHAAGLAALLLSGLAQERRSATARQIRQALMVTARPVGGGSYLDQGTGQPEIGSAWRWLSQERELPEIRVIAAAGASAGWVELPAGWTADTATAFSLDLSAAAAQELWFRSDVDWLEPPASLTLQPGPATVRIGVRVARLSTPGVHTGVVAGWTRDTLLGPVVRLVVTVVAPDTGGLITADLGRIPAGGTGRRFFRAQAGRPFAVSHATGGPGELVLAYLHEPGGRPYREDSGAGAGYGEQASESVVDTRDVVAGLYEAVAVASPLDQASGRVQVMQSPLRIAAARTRAGVEVSLENLTAAPVATAPFCVVVGAERTTAIVARGAERQRVRFTLPSWAVHAAVDIQMEPGAWPRFTDFGVTLLDAAGRQLGKAPMNYAFGRLHVALPEPSSRDSVAVAELALLPAFADPAADDRWTASVSIRLYTDSAHVEQLPGREVTVPAGRQTTVTLPFGGGALPLGDAFVPLGIVVVPEGDRTWTLETPLPPPVTPLTP